ncbi:hypothetical protein A8140_16705 [Vibrio campbellii CAIM 519 = NBRC 15631 = ATCC 25920]|nr:hypothetical protein A8140_16705 [Vibrio campbellii CAIM 519 = NBRC 15631 = ATCC 25920]ELU49513.1 hypothetical protein B878_22941 [Vibrio campbellii CAIM 519 = NBRC 15631 = ATCC 25920]
MLGSARLTWFVDAAAIQRFSGSKSRIGNKVYKPRQLALWERVIDPIAASNNLEIAGYYTALFFLLSNQ